jgi:OOP family OmpA-OmpF porin
MLFRTASLRLARIHERAGGSRSGRHEIKKLLAAIALLFVAGCSEPPPPPFESMDWVMDRYLPIIVFFDWDRSTLSQQAPHAIQQAASWYKAGVITVTGHTDRSGPASYNMALSLRRANAVKEALVHDGVPASAIKVIGKGETQPLLPTDDGVREPQNRRVEIMVP